ncbi:MAG: ABC transporter [Elusimicrobia bacterium GWC2_51_8]|nr:MAG: ABC transporter [Elusimicrobia bacterium GWA2_51_34]OGR58735.1 MAG: ABC transporter [Elusimicrobia bacterium GWC2_51_8]OGR87623.1 MAG: ABC transporter [Elusimicrobia bacterium GWF2_52_66]HAF96354.1 metal ABC transporter permease [Elusimicrobiota bacterium]HCE98540.1 metal ABC transporter permease [Elusimicrobiota bacterium]
MIELMLLPFIAALILTGIHVYLGVHVVERGVIFVDLALAQLAALGAVVSVLFGFSLHSPQAYLFSLGFTFVGAALYAFTRLKDSHVPQEAVIGITYVVAAALAVLVLDRIPGEASHLKEMLVGNIIFVGSAEITKIAVLYGLIGFFHYAFRKKFILISKDPDEAQREGINVRLWDFLFYVTFGFVVTSSVAVAGVLLVFSFLIMPAVSTMLFTNDFKKRLLWGWGLGGLTSLAGIYASGRFDLPTGAAIVCAFGMLVIGAYCARLILRRNS